MKHIHFALLILASLTASLATASESVTISRSVLLDKIKGGWAGQMIGVVYGAPTEFRSNGKILTWDLAWKPGSLKDSLNQDDLYVEMTFAKVMDDLGLDATTQQFGEAFRTSKYSLWHANAGARRALALGIPAPLSGNPKYNFHANDIDFQIEADFIGLMCPGLPRESNRYCSRVGHVMNYGDGVYGGMFVTGMYAAAFTESDPRRLVETGLACLPAESEYAQLLRDVLRWSAQYPQDWTKVWQLIDDRWTKQDPCPDGFLTEFNIDAKVNGAYIALGLLYGGGDFAKTMEIATRCGQDSDCNPSSAAGVIGVVLGYSRIPELYRKEVPPMADEKFSFTNYSFNDIVRSTETRALKVIQLAGGAITADAVQIPVQTPQPAALEQWNPGVPDRRIAVTDSAWQFSGKWEDSKQDNKRISRQSHCAGNEATLRFSGVAIAITGSMHPAGGRAEVYLDGKKQDFPLDAFNDEKTHDNVVWQIYGLPSAEHTLRIVTTDQALPQSKGSEVTLATAVVFRAP
ncbi:MAG: ADP-ribosylglycohydrolase family protein [Opitutaceae bacterium]|jgi:hypothetical protein